MHSSLQQAKEKFHIALCHDDFSRAELLLDELKEENDFQLLRTLFQKTEKKKPLLEKYTGGLPSIFCVAPSYTCHLSCRFCITGFSTRTKIYSDEDYLPAEKFRKVLPWLKNAQTLSFCGHGETLESPDIFKYIDILKKKHKNIHINIVTNGVPLNKGSIRKLVEADIWNITLSVDSVSTLGHGEGKETFQQKAWEKVHWLQEEKKRQKKETPYIHINSVLTKEGLQTLPEHLEVAKSHGVNGVQLVLMIPRSRKFYELSLFPEIEKNLKQIKTIMQKWQDSSMRVNLINGNSDIISGTTSLCNRIGNEASFLRNMHHPIPCCGELALPFGAVQEYSLHQYWNSFPLRLIRYCHTEESKGFMPVSCKECAVLSIEKFAEVTKMRVVDTEDDLYTGYTEGLALKNSGKNDDAKAVFTETLVKKGSHATRGRIYLHLCEIALTAEKYNEAMEHILKAVYYQFDNRKAFSYLYLLSMLTGKKPNLKG